MTCPDCNGSGRVIVEDVMLYQANYSRFAEPYHVEREVECESCRGWGEIEDKDKEE
tara:strand:- start:9859 stop:10026 length:168 start_codon:yes stop_codon:yes gene_type:complete